MQPLANKMLRITLRFRDGNKLELSGAVTAGAENGLYNVVFATRADGVTSIRRWPLDLIHTVEEVPYAVKPDPADKLVVAK